MQYLNCTTKHSTHITLNTISFWSQNTFQHIDVLLNSYEDTGAILCPYFKESLNSLTTHFNDIYQASISSDYSMSLKQLLQFFLDTNRQFIMLLERLKFEAFNGYPVLYETVHHFLYEQLYAQKLFATKDTPSMNLSLTSVPINTSLTLQSKDLLRCMYSHIYFWSIIAAQHTSIILTVSPVEAMLPECTQKLLQHYRNEFNRINFDLSSIYSHLTKVGLFEILNQFTKLNNGFLKILEDFKSPNSSIFPNAVKLDVPQLFFGILEHLIDEHMYIISLCTDFRKALYYE